MARGGTKNLAGGSSLARTVKSQHGLISRRQLLNGGMSRDEIAHRLDRGYLIRHRSGVYGVGHLPSSPLASLMSATLACGPGAVISHLSAGALWEICDRPEQIHLIQPRNGSKPSPGIVVHRIKTLQRDEYLARDGIPVTTVARTLLDIASLCGSGQPYAEDDLEAAIEAASRKGRLRPAEVRRVLAVTGRRRGAGRLRRAFARWDPERRPTRSDFERRVRRDLERTGAAPTETNVIVNGHEVDMLWRERRLMVELDGARHHRGDASFENDRSRDLAFSRSGFRVIRISWRMYASDPAGTIAHVVSILRDQEAVATALA